MIVSNILFDIVLFGALIAAAVADGAFPATAGAATLVVIGVATYLAAQDWCDGLLRRRLWSQDSLSTAIALSTLGFIYFWWRNQSDLFLLVLSIGLMMASLMVAIAVIAAFGQAFAERDAKPLGGLFLTVGGSLLMGGFAGTLVLFFSGTTLLPQATLYTKLIVMGLGLFAWKIRETLLPPRDNVHALNADASGETAGGFDLSLPATATQRWALIPNRGTLLDRFVPVLVLGVVLFITAKNVQFPELWTPTPAASANDFSSGLNSGLNDGVRSAR